MLKAFLLSYLQIKRFAQINVRNFLNFLSSNEQKVTSNERKVTSNEENVMSNEQKVTSNNQQAKMFTLLKCQQKIQMSLWAWNLTQGVIKQNQNGHRLVGIEVQTDVR